jgi:DNA-binding NarL/FixJ family response regulator
METPGAPRVRVLIADDSAVIRRTVAHMLEGVGIEVVATAETGVEALEGTRRAKPDVVLLDMHLPDAPGMTALESIKRECPAVAVLIYSGDDDPAFVRRAQEKGADGYVVKGEKLSSLVAAIRGAVARRQG